MDIYKLKFGKRLREARKKIPDLSQERFAELVGVEGPSVSRWETGKDFPDSSRLPKICEVLRVAPDYFEQPEQVIRQDPLPEWAEKISMRLREIETKIFPGEDNESELLRLFRLASPERREAIIAHIEAALRLDQKEASATNLTRRRNK